MVKFGTWESFAGNVLPWDLGIVLLELPAIDKKGLPSTLLSPGLSQMGEQRADTSVSNKSVTAGAHVIEHLLCA